MEGPRQAKVKNKAPAPIQITAEQLLREASERLDPTDSSRRVRQFIDNEDRADYQLRNRTFFEDKLRRNRHHIAIWLRYANWEESQSEWKRARSIYERALDVDPYNVTIYLRYGEMEMRLGHVGLARNLWDRVTTILPRLDQFWYKYVLMEESLGEVERARGVWERWMNWQPGEESIWLSYVKFERRHGELVRARRIFDRLVACHSTVSAWLAYAKFCEENPLKEEATNTSGQSKSQLRLEEVGNIFERAMALIESKNLQPKLFIEFARFETRRGDYDKARKIYHDALNRWPKSEAEGLWHSYAQFERQHGGEKQVNEVIMMRRRTQYLERVTNQPKDYDAWFDLIRLEEEEAHQTRDWAVVREVYERAIANVPPQPVMDMDSPGSVLEEKRLWRRYVYIWIYYATFEEVEVGDPDRAEAIYRTVLDLLPHRRFTFAKLWLGLAMLQIRKLNLSGARKTLGTALGICPKPKLFKGYIGLEMKLWEFDRCRRLYERWLEWDPARSMTWLAYAELEQLFDDEDRTRAIYELAITEGTETDAPETIWMSYITWETEEGRWKLGKALWERLIERSNHLRVWISYAAWRVTCQTADQGEKALNKARKILKRAMEAVYERGIIAERVWLLEAWRDLELDWAQGDETNANVQIITSRQPRKEVRSRITDNGEREEYVEYIFPDDEVAKPAAPVKLLDMAKKWKKARVHIDEL